MFDIYKDSQYIFFSTDEERISKFILEYLKKNTFEFFHSCYFTAPGLDDTHNFTVILDGRCRGARNNMVEVLSRFCIGFKYGESGTLLSCVDSMSSSSDKTIYYYFEFSGGFHHGN